LECIENIWKERDQEEDAFEKEREVVEMSGSVEGEEGPETMEQCEDLGVDHCQGRFQVQGSFLRARRIQPLLFLGLFTCIASGAMTPVLSFLFSRLLFEVSTSAHNISTINFFGGGVLGTVALDGLLIGLKYFLMETAGNTWVLHIRRQGFTNVLAHDKKWFDMGENAGVRLVQTLVKDGDYARNLLALVGVGLVWAMVRGWQLTLVGMVAPVFSGIMALQAALAEKWELRNERAREEVVKGYYDVIFFLLLVEFVDVDGIFGRQL
jgi:ATP-binding cassette, subfamily B (MDR/TAP), member 1